MKIRTPGEETKLSLDRTRLIASATVVVILILIYFIASSILLYRTMEESYGLEVNTATDAVNTTEEIYQAQIALTKVQLQVARYGAKEISKEDLVNALDAAESIFFHFAANQPIGSWLAKVISANDAITSADKYFRVANELHNGTATQSQAYDSYLIAARNWSLLTTDVVSMGNISNLRRLAGSTLKMIAAMLALCAVVLTVAVYYGLRVARTNDVQFKRLQLMASSIGHDLKSPIQIIQNANTLLSKNDLLPSTRAKYTALISKSTKNMARMIDDVLNIMLRTELSVAKTPTNISQWAAEFAIAAKQKAANNNLDWHLDCKLSAIDTVDVDADRLTQCVGNLVDNALRYTSQGSVRLEVRLEEAEDGGRLILVVEDTGPGISQVEQKRIFEPFERGENSAQHTSGMGLGLTIVNGLIAAMQGELTLLSELGRGSKFKISIPVTISVVETPRLEITPDVQIFSAIAKSDLAAEIMVVDDDGDILGFITDALREAGFTVDVAYGGQEAWEKAQGHDYKIILTDIHMPGMSGIELARCIRNKGMDTILIAMSAGLTKNQMSGDLSLMSAVIGKPFHISELFEVMEPFEDRM